MDNQAFPIDLEQLRMLIESALEEADLLKLHMVGIHLSSALDAIEKAESERADKS